MDYTCNPKRVFRCEYCQRAFSTRKALRIHRAKKHEVYSDECIQVVRVDDSHMQINMKIRKSLYDELMTKVKRSGVDLPKFLLEAFTFGDFLFDEEVKACIAQKTWQYIQSMASESKKTSYIS